MQRITLLCIGTPKEAWVREACALYQTRLGRAVILQVLALPASKEKDPAKQRAEESKRLRQAAATLRGDLCVLDEAGKRCTTLQFATSIACARDRGDHLVFVLGGAYGLADDLKSAGNALRLSDMTLPHELCRVLFLEQLYRATEILKGSGYHHA